MILKQILDGLLQMPVQMVNGSVVILLAGAGVIHQLIMMGQVIVILLIMTQLMKTVMLMMDTPG
jgi:hypothetical protein